MQPARPEPCPHPPRGLRGQARRQRDIKGTEPKFPVLTFYDEDPELWFWQLEATLTVNKVTTEKDNNAVVVFNLPFKVVRRIPRTIIKEKEPYSVLK